MYIYDMCVCDHNQMQCSALGTTSTAFIYFKPMAVTSNTQSFDDFPHPYWIAITNQGLRCIQFVVKYPIWQVTQWGCSVHFDGIRTVWTTIAKFQITPIDNWLTIWWCNINNVLYINEAICCISFCKLWSTFIIAISRGFSSVNKFMEPANVISLNYLDLTPSFYFHR